MLILFVEAMFSLCCGDFMLRLVTVVLCYFRCVEVCFRCVVRFYVEACFRCVVLTLLCCAFIPLCCANFAVLRLVSIVLC